MLALSYLANQLWSDISQEKRAVVRVLQLILLTKQGSNEAQSMLAAVLNIVAKPLEHALRLSQRQHPKSQDIEPLLRAIKENVRFSRRTAGAGHNELEAWTATAGGGLAAAVRHTIQGLIQWSLHPGINITPTPYTHRQFLAALRILGARRLLYILLDEAKQQAEAGSSSVAYDVATALVCAPDAATTTTATATTTGAPSPPSSSPLPTPPQSRLSLRQALRFEAEDFKALQKQDPATAEHVVRLHRRVEAQLLELPPQPGVDVNVDDAVAAADAAAAAVAAAADLGDALGSLVGAGSGAGAGGGGSDYDAAEAAAVAAAEAELDNAIAAAAARGSDYDAAAAAAVAAAEAELDNAIAAAAAMGASGPIGPDGGGGGGDPSAGGVGVEVGELGDDDIFGGLGDIGNGAGLLDGWDGILQ